MKPEDDPEARIRELERPLNARATELGTGQDTSYPPPPTYPLPPAYPMPGQGWSGGTQVQAPPPNRNRLWLVLAVIAVGLIALAGGAVIYSVSDVTSGVPMAGDPSRPSGGGGAFDTTATPSPAAPTAPAESGAQLSVSGIGENRTLVCDESAVSISGVSNTVVITGHCSTVQVSGVSNVVTIDSAGEIDASGIQNRVTFHTGEPTINNSGSDNSVEQG
jgi:Protein of unknown function (DUF3060)